MPQPDTIFSFGVEGDGSVIRAQNRMNSSFGALKKIALAAGAVIAGIGLKNLAVESFELAAGLEQSTIAWTNFTSGAEEANSVLGKIEDKAAKTPFRFQELEKTSRLLVAFGEGTDTVLDTVGRLGDLAAGTGNNISELGVIYGKARVQGRLFAEDINQFTGRGIPIIQELAKQFGVADSQVKKLTEQGKIGFDNLEIAFRNMTSEGGKFFGLTEKLAGSASGKLSTMRDNIDRLKREIGQKLLPIASQAFEDITKSIQRVFLGMKDVEGGSKALDGAFKVLKVTAQTIIGVFEGVATTFKTVGSIVALTLESIFPRGGGQDVVVTNAVRWEGAFRGFAKSFGLSTQATEKFFKESSILNPELLKRKIFSTKSAFLVFVKAFKQWGRTVLDVDKAQEKAANGIKKIGDVAKFAAGSIGDFEERISEIKNQMQQATDSGAFDSLNEKVKALQLGINTIKFGTKAEELRQFLDAATGATGTGIAGLLPTNESLRGLAAPFDFAAAAAESSKERIEAAMKGVGATIKAIGVQMRDDFAVGFGQALGQAVVGTAKLGDSLKRLSVDLISAGLRAAGMALIQTGSTPQMLASAPANLPFIFGGLALLGASGFVSGLGSGIGSGGPQGTGGGPATTTPAAAPSPAIQGLGGFDGNVQDLRQNFNIYVSIDGDDVAARVTNVQKDQNRRRGR